MKPVRGGMAVCQDHVLSTFSDPADRALVLSPDCPVPKVPGVYIWYFRSVPGKVPISDCIERYGGHLLYAELGVLLESTSGHALRRVGSGERYTLTAAGEAWLSDWLAAHALVCWREHPAPWGV